MSTWKSGAVTALFAVFIVSITLNSIGLSWGQTGHIPWQSDSLGGVTTLRQMPYLFGKWKYKYPRVQFLINAAFYKPMLDKWTKNPVWSTVEGNSKAVPRVLDFNRINTLIIISNIISAIMGTATVAAVFLMVRILFDDFLASFLAALSLACCHLFVFYSHLGNVDVPATFWFSWGMYFAIKAVYIGKWQHFLLAGLFCALSACTKDPMPVFIAGLVLAVFIAMLKNARSQGKAFKEALCSIFNMKLLVAIVAFLFVYALLNDILTFPSAFVERFSHWIGGRGVTAFNKGFVGQGPLLWGACKVMYGAFGWPLLASILISLVYCVIKNPCKSMLGIIPIVLFYIVIVVNVRMVAPRFFIPAFPCLVLFVGKGFADWLRWHKFSFFLRVIPVIMIYVFSALYCIGLDLEMRNDSRYDAENWFVENVSPKTHVGVLCNVRWGPRLHILGYNCSFRAPLRKTNIGEEVLKQRPSYPKYLILLENKLSIFNQNFLESIFDGSLGYKRVARFENKYLYPRKTIFGIAGWPVSKTHLVSPAVEIYEKSQDDPFS